MLTLGMMQLSQNYLLNYGRLRCWIMEVRHARNYYSEHIREDVQLLYSCGIQIL